jgi:hypothetical protein
MIYGENTAVITFDKGLYLSDTPDAIPDGFSQELINMEVDDLGHLKDRGDFVPCLTNMAVADAGLPISDGGVNTGRPPDYLNAQTVKLFRFYPPTANQTTPTLVICRNTVPTGQRVWSTASGRGSFNEGMEQGLDVVSRRILDMTSYRDRYYACNQAKTEIYRVSDFNTASFSPPNLTTTLLFTISGVTKIFTYGDRLFALAGNKIYFTDLASVGGYPEVWSTTNVIEMPSSRGGGPLVTAVPVNNKVYLFTQAGVYVFYPNGDPTNWSLQFMTDQIRASGEFGVCLTQNSLIVTDRTAIYAFSENGSTKIDYPISDLFATYNSAAVFPFENGFILVVTKFFSSGGLWTFAASNTKVYYNNGKTWSQLILTPEKEFGEDTFISVVGAAGPLFTHNSPDKPRSVIAYIHREEGSNSNFLGLSHYSPDTSNRPKTVSVFTKWHSKPFSTLKRWLYGYLDVYLKGAGVYYTHYVDGNIVGTSTFLSTTPVSGVNDDRNNFVKMPMPQFNRRVAFKFTLDIPETGGAWSPSTVENPYIKLKSVHMMGNETERNHQDGSN